jgi:cytochrome c oxidase subunit 2
MIRGGIGLSTIGAGAFLGVVCFVHGAAATPLDYMHGDGDRAYPVVRLTWGVTIISLAVIVVICALLAGAIWHRPGFGRAEPGERLALVPGGGGASWIWVGVSISALVLVFCVVWTMAVLARVNWPATSPALTLEVTGHEWWWSVRYLSQDPSRIFTTANEIHIPTGTPVRFRLIGADVIHSFWVPALSGKTDVIPGQINETWLEAARPGTYRGQCTEYCGLEHAHMAFFVVAQTPVAFRAWWSHQLTTPAQPPAGAAARGETEFDTHCGACHAVRGTDAGGNLGPDLSHLMTRTTLAAGTLPNDPADLARWISDPQGVKPGSLMQKPEIGTSELNDIQAYLATLD